MEKNNLIKILKRLDIRPETISFYVDETGKEYFSTITMDFCDITGNLGELVGCTALNNNGEIIYFQVLETLVGGELGKLAGAF